VKTDNLWAKKKPPKSAPKPGTGEGRPTENPELLITNFEFSNLRFFPLKGGFLLIYSKKN